MKKIKIAIIGVVVACACVGAILFTVWSSFVPSAIVGSHIQTNQTTLYKATEEWFTDFFQQYIGIHVPFHYRLSAIKLDEITVLDEEEGYVQIDYLFKPTSDNTSVIAYYNGIYEADGWYSSQLVLNLKIEAGGYQVTEKLSPVQYQIMTDTSLRTPQTTQYAMLDETETFVFQKQKLYVTYDKGETLLEVPVAYEDVAGTNNETYNEALPKHGYIVSKAFTAFVCYDDDGSYLFYSNDEGKNWSTSRILPVSYRGDSLYLSKTNVGVYITLATDRSLSHEYYSTYKSSDLKSWEYVQGDAIKEKSEVIFLNDGVSYINAGHDENSNALVFYTRDEWASYQTLTIPAYETELLGNKIKPFIQMEYVYQEDGNTYMIVGQGANGDYVKNKAIVKGLFVSTDGENFTFVKEIYDSYTLAG